MPKNCQYFRTIRRLTMTSFKIIPLRFSRPAALSMCLPFMGEWFCFIQRIDLMCSSDTTDEGTIFVPRNVNTVRDSKDFIQAQYPVISPEHLNDLEKLYPPDQKYPNAGQYWHSTSAAYGELRYVCPGIHLSQIYASNNVKGNYNYRYVFIPTSCSSDPSRLFHHT